MKPKDRTAMLAMLALLPLVLVALCYSRLPGQVSLPWSGQETGGKAGLWLWAALGRCWPCCPGWSGGNSAGPLRLPPWSSCMS